MSAASLSRHQQILRMLQSDGVVRVSEVSVRLSVSEMTIRRDLLDLENQGLLQRVYGGAVLNTEHDIAYNQRQGKAQAEKRLIAERAARLVQSGQHIYLDAGSTTMALAQALLRRARDDEDFWVHITTHALNIAGALVGHPRIRGFQIGGEIYRESFGVIGGAAAAQIHSLGFDLFFMGVCGVHPESGLTNTNSLEVEIKRAALERSKATYVLADSSKWELSSFAVIAPLNAAKAWITDGGLPPSARKTLRRLGLETLIAERTTAHT